MTKITSDGTTASYYQLPEGCTELQDLISYRNMNFFDGLLFCLCYDHAVAVSIPEKLRLAREMVKNAERELRRLESLHPMQCSEAPS